MENYTKLQSKYIEEIQSNVTIYSHNKTKARVCIMENDDTNKVFSIAFRTPAINDAGLTHILEHSVLCGSKKYPVKDPFVELLKSSLNTFLNAMTFPDKTMYPCASVNDKDFKNLMSVYMDAVFYPEIYNHEEIFMQEGWHYHILDKNDPITYNGVVYNEMKGAFSDPQQVLFRNILHSVFPNNCYQYESGGYPKYIPTLSYEEFKNFHSKFYHPSNSYIMIYGNCDMAERMEWLDKEYLSKFDRIDFDTTIKYQRPFDAPVYVTDYYPIGKEEPKENKTFLSYNVVLPTTLDTKLTLAMDILVQALLDVPGAPLKEALIKANLGSDVDYSFDDGLIQPMLTIAVSGSNPDKESDFIRVINKTLAKMVNNGLDKSIFESIINFSEFKAREKAFSSRSPKGLDIEMVCLSSWLYSDEQPFSKLEILKYFKELREDLKGNYFEKLIETYILANNHKSYVRLEPSYDCLDKDLEEDRVKLLEYKNSLSDSELEALINRNKELIKYQSEPSTKEALDTLPKLELKDIDLEPEEYKLEVIDDEYKLLYSDYYINDITYFRYYFDISHMKNADLLYLELYMHLLVDMSTKNHSYSELGQIIKNNTGGLNGTILPFTDLKGECKLYAAFSFSALASKAKLSNDLCYEIMTATDFSDTVRLREKLVEIKSMLDMSVVQRGHVAALNRALSHVNELNNKKECLLGIDYIDFISDLVKSYDSKKDEIVARLSMIRSEVFAKDNLIVGFTGSRDELNSLKPLMDEFYNKLPNKAIVNKEEFKPSMANEALTSQFNVNFVARGFNMDRDFNGAMSVLSNALSMDYLWQRVRVHGGAYGCMINMAPSGVVGLTSYRDPHIKSTLEAYDGISEFIDSLVITDEDLLKYKIGAFGASQSVMHDKDKADAARMIYLRGDTHEHRKQIREEIVKATKEDLKNISSMFKDGLRNSPVCVIGNEAKINSEKELFDTIRPLTK